MDGGKRLKGEIVISGSKNAALPILIATLLTDETCVIKNVPHLDDIETVIALLVFLGKKIVRKGDAVEVAAGGVLHAEAPYELVRKMRARHRRDGAILAWLETRGKRFSREAAPSAAVRSIFIWMASARSAQKINLEQGYVDVTSEKLKGSVIHLDSRV